MGRGGPGGPRWGHQLGLRLRQNKQAGGVYKVREAAKKILLMSLKKSSKICFLPLMDGTLLPPPSLNGPAIRRRFFIAASLW